MSMLTSAARSIQVTYQYLTPTGEKRSTGDEQFQGSADVSWSELDEQGSNSSWENDSFKDQNETEADANYVGTLESPSASNVIGADGNTSANDGDSTDTYFQETA